MYFIPFNNQLYSWAVNIKPLYRIILSVSCVLFLLASFYLTHSLITINNTQLKTGIAQLHKQLIDQKKAENDIKVLKTSIEKMNISFANYAQRVPSTQSQINFILRSLQNSGLQITNYSADQSKDKQWYTKQKPQFQIEGSWEQMNQFLSSLKSCQKMIQCNQLVIADNDTKQQATVILSLQQIKTRA